MSQHMTDQSAPDDQVGAMAHAMLNANAAVKRSAAQAEYEQASTIAMQEDEPGAEAFTTLAWAGLDICGGVSPG